MKGAKKLLQRTETTQHGRTNVAETHSRRNIAQIQRRRSQSVAGDNECVNPYRIQSHKCSRIESSVFLWTFTALCSPCHWFNIKPGLSLYPAFPTPRKQEKLKLTINGNVTALNSIPSLYPLPSALSSSLLVRTTPYT